MIYYNASCLTLLSSLTTLNFNTGGATDRNSVEVFSLTDQTWRDGPSLPHPIKFAGSVSLNGTFLIVGGLNVNDPYYKDILEYDVENEAWLTRPEKLSKPKIDATVVLMDSETVQCLT